MSVASNEPREFWSNWMSMDESLDEAKDNWPRAEWEDIRCFVEKSAYGKLQARVAELETQLEFTKKYLNPADTSFRQMIDAFRSLSKENQEKLIDLSRSLLALKGAE